MEARKPKQKQENFRCVFAAAVLNVFAEAGVPIWISRHSQHDDFFWALTKCTRRPSLDVGCMATVLDVVLTNV